MGGEVGKETWERRAGRDEAPNRKRGAEDDPYVRIDLLRPWRAHLRERCGGISTRAGSCCMDEWQRRLAKRLDCSGKHRGNGGEGRRASDRAHSGGRGRRQR